MANSKAKPKGEFELRFSDPDGEFQADEEGVVEGYAVVFDRPADIGGMFREYVDRGALETTDLRDVQFLVNHNGQGITLARSRRNNKNSTMQLSVDDKGLKVRAKLDVENNPEARALVSAIKRGDITGMSFQFTVEEDRWEGLRTKMPTRHILRIGRIREVSAVNAPAYQATSITARSQASEEALESARSALDKADATELELAKAKNEIYFI